MNFKNGIGLVLDPDISKRWLESAMAEESLSQLRCPPELAQQNAVQIQQLEEELTQAIMTSDDPKTALSKLARLLGEAFQVDCCMIAGCDRSQSLSQVASWCSTATATFSQGQFCLSSVIKHPLIEKGLAHSSPLIIPNLQLAAVEFDSAVQSGSVEAALPTSLPQELPQAILAIWTSFQGQINGAIVLARSRPYEWIELEAERLKTLADRVAIAISQDQLEQQVQQQACYQSLINQLTEAIRADWDLEQIFQLAVEGSVSALRVSRGLLLLLKYSDPLFKSRTTDRIPKAKATVECEYPKACERSNLASTDLSSDIDSNSGTWLKQSFWVSECGMCQHLFSERLEPIVLPTLHTTSSSLSPLGNDGSVAPIFNPEVMPSQLLMPLENQGTVLGCLVLQHEQHRFWQPEELGFVKLVAAQLSTAIIQTRTLRQVQSLVEERTAQLRHSLDVQAKLYEKTRQQVEQLRRLNQVMEEFLSTVSHELLTPLTSMTLAIRMLRQVELSPERRITYLDILERQCAQETNLINDLLALQKLESRSTAMRSQTIDLKYPLQHAAQSFEENWVQKRLALEVDLPTDPLTICTDADSFNRILIELLTNAGKYADPDTTVRLQAIHQVESQVKQVKLTICNIGAGITPEEMPYIFDKFRRGEGVTQRAIPGTGLGLSLVKGLVEHIGGAIAATSAPLGETQSWGTCFMLILPQSPDTLL